MAFFGYGNLDSEHGVILKDWSAQDFANIYVRFRPHLISHARKFLREDSQAEEVVQDAFLYLMTALPDLDSELGVLRFLKWKTKMLCLDTIRSSQAGIQTKLVPLTGEILDETQPIDSLERADDAAIIRLALAKLNPRHREALIASIYEEKSHEEVAQQMGLGDNALRQLLFRARASFRQALIGEADVRGMSASEILSIAVQKSIARSSLALLIILSVLSASPIAWNLSQTNTLLSDPGLAPQFEVAGPEVRPDLPILPHQDLYFSPTEASEQSGAEADTQSEDFLSISSTDIEHTFGLSELVPRSHSADSSDAEPGITHASDERIERAQLLLDEALLGRLTVDVVAEANVLSSMELRQLELKTDQGIRATFTLSDDPNQLVVFAWFELELEEHVIALVPQSITQVKVEGEVFRDCPTVVLADFVVGDVGGSLGSVAFSDGLMSRNAALLEFCQTHDGLISDSSLIFSNRQ